MTRQIDRVEEILSKREERVKDMRDNWEVSKHILGPVIEEIGPLCTNISADEDINFSVSGEKEVLLKCIRALRRAGFTTSNRPPRKGEISWAALFNHHNSEMRIFFMFSSTVCKRVQIGTKLEEIPVFETQCGDPNELSLLDGLAAGLKPIVIGEDSDIPS